MENRELMKYIFTDEDILEKAWIFDAKTSNAEIDLNYKYIIWRNGAWLNGAWKNGVWEDGIWLDGVWEDGIWKKGTWKNGCWQDGVWENGTWENGTWKKGSWLNGTWNGGVWNGGRIYDSKERKYKHSDVAPSECEWSLSYGK